MVVGGLRACTRSFRAPEAGLKGTQKPIWPSCRARRRGLARMRRRRGPSSCPPPAAVEQALGYSNSVLAIMAQPLSQTSGGPRELGRAGAQPLAGTVGPNSEDRPEEAGDRLQNAQGGGIGPWK